MSAYDRLRVFYADHSQWSQETFGSDTERGPIGPIKHLQKEAEEVLRAPYDLEEYADCFMLILDACRRARFTLLQLLSMAENKLEENKRRKWPPMGPEDAVEHIKPQEAVSVVHFVLNAQFEGIMKLCEEFKVDPTFVERLGLLTTITPQKEQPDATISPLPWPQSAGEERSG